MGQLIKNDDTCHVSRCSNCNDIIRNERGYFIYTFSDLLAESEDVQKAYQWFSNKNFDIPPSDVIDKRRTFTDEELGYIFVLEEFIKKIMTEKKAQCPSCFNGI
jgi:hypothetical protein